MRTNCIDEFWNVWSVGAEAGLFRAYRRASGLVTSGIHDFLGQGTLHVRRRRLGGGTVGGGAASKLYRVSQGDDVDVESAQYFVNSSLARVLVLRRRDKSVADVPQGIRQNCFSQERWDALCGRWK